MSNNPYYASAPPRVSFDQPHQPPPPSYSELTSVTTNIDGASSGGGVNHGQGLRAVQSMPAYRTSSGDDGKSGSLKRKLKNRLSGKTHEERVEERRIAKEHNDAEYARYLAAGRQMAEEAMINKGVFVDPTLGQGLDYYTRRINGFGASPLLDTVSLGGRSGNSSAGGL